MNDLRYALRMLLRNLAFTAVVVLTLALGVGANTAIFTLIDAVILRHIAVRHPEQLIALGNTARVGSLSQGSPRTDLFSYPLYRDLRDRSTLVSGLVASGYPGRLDVATGAEGREPVPPRARLASANYFRVLGVDAAMGRTFDGSEDATIGGAPVVVISDGYWTRRFGRDPRAVGQTITVNGAGFTIIGVAARGYTGEIVGTTIDLWIPLTMQHVVMPNQKLLDDRSSNFLLLLGRLKPGVTLAQAKAGFTTLIHQALADNATQRDPAAVLRELPVFVSSGAGGFSRVRQTYSVPLYTLMVGVGLLLLIVCANVANLLLGRAVARAREMGIRLAIGAGRADIVRQLLTECALLALLSACAGLLLSWWGSRLLLRLAADGAAVIPLDLCLDVPVLAFTGVISLVTVGIFGLVPALRVSRVNLATSLRAQGRSVLSAFGRSGVTGGRLLIGAQVAVSLVLLVGAGLLVRSLRSVESADVGLDRDHLLMVGVDALDHGYRGERLRTLIRDLTDRMSRIRGVSGVTYSENGIFSGTESRTSLQIPGFTPRSRDDTMAAYDDIGPGYVRAIGAHLLQGREFTAADDQRSLRVALVNAAMARFYFPGQSPIGRTIVVNDSVILSIVGVVGDIRDHELTAPSPRRFYRPYLQYPLGSEPGTLNLAIRATGDPVKLIPDVRRAIAATDASLRGDDIDTLASLMRASIQQERVVARLATGFGALALLLAGIGLYGVLTYAVTRRTNEIGLRVALGAQQQDVVRMVLGDALQLVFVGILVGAPLALAATQLLRSQLYDVHPADPIALATALGVLTACAIVAALIPARRAARLDALVALRVE
jgi:putative ABC transport system permease protein